MKTAKEQTEPGEARPFWKDENRIAAASRLATANCKHLNAVVCPLCELCGLPITEEKTRAYIGNLGAIEEDYLAIVMEQTAGVTDFLARPIEQEARQRFADYLNGLSGAIKRNPAKAKETYYKLGGLEEIRLKDIEETIRLQGQYFRVDFSMIEQLFTHILSDADMAKYERQKAACAALNDFFRGGADNFILQAAFLISGGEVYPNTKLNYNLIR